MEFGIKLSNHLLNILKKQVRTDISVVVPDGSKFKFLAKTHNLTIPDSATPWLRGIMESGQTRIRQLHKDTKDLITIYGPLKDYSGKVIGVLAVPRDISSLKGNLKSEIITMSVLALLFWLALVVMVWLLIRYLINKPIAKLINSFQKCSRGDLSSLVHVGSVRSVSCSEKSQCGKTDCKSFGKEAHCWEVCGSMASELSCPRIVNGKHSNCTECDLYKEGVQDEFAELGTMFNGLINSFGFMIATIQKDTITILITTEPQPVLKFAAG